MRWPNLDYTETWRIDAETEDAIPLGLYAYLTHGPRVAGNPGLNGATPLGLRGHRRELSICAPTGLGGAETGLLR